MEESSKNETPKPASRRYYCEYCGIGRSKKSLITSHVQIHHKEEMGTEKMDENEEIKGLKKSYDCKECGFSFKKPAYLKQHMQSHSFERLYVCSIDDCHKSYRRKDHLTRHLLQHDGKLFKCPIETCDRQFVFQGNVKRHVDDFHSKSSSSTSSSNDDGGQKQYICQEPGCGKAFKHPSRLRTHEESHDKLEPVEAICGVPGCMKHFANIQCLKDHIHSFHRYITCEFCGTKQLKKNFKRHLRTHEAPTVDSNQRIKCHFKDCSHTFSNKTNLNQHIKAVHFEIKRFACGFPSCNMRFFYKHVRDRHEKSGCHVYTPGDFEETDEQFSSRPRGGRKRKCPTVETLMRKRVNPPSDLDEYRAWLHQGV